MPRPGVDVSILELPGAVSVPTDTGVWFVTGITERGPLTPSLVQSLNDFNNQFGQRVSYSIIYDCMETYFREGGNSAYIARVVGPAAAVGTLNLPDASAAISLVANGNGPGAWSANYKIAVIAGVTPGTYIIEVEDLLGNILESSGELPDQPSAVAWSQYSNYVRITQGAALDNPAPMAATALSAGNDDRANATDAQYQAALDSFGIGLGPGQVSSPGRTTATAYAQLVAHADAKRRVAILDGANTPTAATLISAFSTITDRFTAVFAPWMIIPGVVVNTTRTVPPSPFIAGLCCQNDHLLGPNAASAGNDGQSAFALDLTQPDWNDTDRANLNNNGINVIRRMYGGIRNYGWRSQANPNSDRNWLSFGNSRLYMAIAAELDQAGENYMFSEIDGQQGLTIQMFGQALNSVLDSHWRAGELFGTAAQAYSVDVGPTVNTLQTIANLELHAVCYVLMSPFAEWVEIQVVKNKIGQ